MVLREVIDLFTYNYQFSDSKMNQVLLINKQINNLKGVCEWGVGKGPQ